MSFRMFGQLFFFLAALFFVFGLVMHFADKIPWIGRLPGDLVFKKKNFVLYFPIMTSLLLSLLLSIIFSLFFRR